MLSLLFVQVLTGLALTGTLVAVLLGRSGWSASREPVRVIAVHAPARGTQAAWITGTISAVFWGVGVFLAPTDAYHWPAFPDFPDSWVVQILGIILAATGGTLYARAARVLGRHMTPAIRVQDGHRLVQEGPYRYIRHPVYTAILSVAIGQSLFFLSVPVALLALLLIGLARYRARLEERLLASPEAFGDTYLAYMARTGRFLPRLSSTQ